jgi:ubiquinone/menaquinone biosynthesis C-methylase UbiE
VATSEELKQQQRSQWSGNAASWDSMHDRLGREMAEVTTWLCREARIEPGMRVLDLACGSGHPALDIAALVGPGGSVVASDLVPEMLEAVRRRADAARLDNLETRVIDLEAIDFPDARFDAATCRFGVMFCPDPLQALREARRVLKPGALFAFSVWDMPEKSPGQTVIGTALARLGREQPAVDYEAPGIYQLAPPGKLGALLRAAGFREIKLESRPLDFEYESLEALWQRSMGRPGGLRARVAEMAEGEIERLKAALAEVVLPYTRDGSIHLPTTPLLAAARQ